MPLLGPAALAMWSEVSPAMQDEFQQWHSQEHFPERMRVPGFRRGSRWRNADGSGGFFVLYEVESYETLTSSPYLERLNNPTPWSIRMMPHHGSMVRSQTRVWDSFGGLTAEFLATLRLSPQPGQGDLLRAHLRQKFTNSPSVRGLVGAHLLKTETPAAPQTLEQKIRGGDAAADWILLVAGWDRSALLSALSGSLDSESLVASGADPDQKTGVFHFVHAITSADCKPE